MTPSLKRNTRLKALTEIHAMKRRNFFKGVASLLVAPQIIKALPAPPPVFHHGVESVLVPADLELLILDMVAKRSADDLDALLINGVVNHATGRTYSPFEDPPEYHESFA